MKKRISLLLSVGASLAVSFGVSAVETQINPGAEPSIRPTDWQFQVLKAIDRQHQCFPGFLVFAERKIQSVSRYEFAAVVDACRDRMKKLLPGLVRREDLKNFEILEKEFAAELGVLRDRNAEVERQQFSTTTKSEATVIFEILPDNWRYQALMTLIKRYGCVVGSEFSTHQALSRSQFAVGLNACIDRANEVIAATTSDGMKKEDVEMLQKLEQEFVPELQILRGLIAQVDMTTAERQQFSTTGDLRSQVVFAMTPDLEVKRTDWEFGELRSLSQRYNCTIDFLSKNQPVTRLEFATNLRNCLDQINELIAKRTEAVPKADIARFEKLSEVFSAELLSFTPSVYQPSRPR